MNKKLKNKFPSWVNKINKNNKLILTNDLDSLFTVAVLKKLFGCEVGMFYDFESLYSTQSNFNKEDVIGVDLALEDKELKTFCNHVTKMWKDDEVNPNSANLNNIAGIYGARDMSNYTEKYAGSTLLTVLSLYDAFENLLLEGHKELTETQKMILVSIDSYFFSKHFKNGEYFYYWQELLGLEMFNDVLDKYSKDDLMQFQKDHDLKGSIFMEEDGLYHSLDFQFLQEHFPMLDFNINVEFVHRHKFKETIYRNYSTLDSKHNIEGDIFSLAVVSSSKVSYTINNSEVLK